jgi:sulfane dehydrogenase subunit SoxC
MMPPVTDFSLEEVQLAARNHGMPLEALRYPITPTGLHYLLTHFDIPAVDPASWRLTVSGRVGRELTLSLDDLRARPALTLPVTFECAGNGRAQLEPHVASQPWVAEAVGTGSWTGIPVRTLLDEAELMDDAREVLFAGLDRGVDGEVEQDYERSLTLEEARRDGVILAFALNGEPLPPQHGFPLRLVVPGWYGMTNVKWLRGITVLSEPFAGYQQAHAYRLRARDDEEGTPVTRMMPRALMLPPGVPDFFTRRRLVSAGSEVGLEGRAWSGWAPIARVEVSMDGGSSWEPAELGEAPGPFAWVAWSLPWTPPVAGDYELSSRATDQAGNQQPLEPPWNVGGYSNNAVQRVQVVAR